MRNPDKNIYYFLNKLMTVNEKKAVGRLPTAENTYFEANASEDYLLEN